jgi:hypothetical protein
LYVPHVPRRRLVTVKQQWKLPTYIVVTRKRCDFGQPTVTQNKHQAFLENPTQTLQIKSIFNYFDFSTFNIVSEDVLMLYSF